MEINLDGLNETYMDPKTPKDQLITIYSQIFENMQSIMKENLTFEEWDAVLISYDLMVKYFSEINQSELTGGFNTMRVMYMNIINDSIKEIEEVLKNE
jgi:anionic cell wall polymer biosynthesis LytR-Cps2A-Psr (LCP) family protein